MFEFKGEFSETSKQYLVNKLSKGILISILIPSIFFSILIVLFAAICNYWILAIALVAPFISILGAAIIPKTKKEREKTLLAMLPKTVVIQNNHIHVFWQNRTMIKDVDDIKKIIDSNGCYYIIFYIPKESDVICQKNLMTKGNIEQFESFFKNKIVKKD